MLLSATLIVLLAVHPILAEVSLECACKGFKDENECKNPCKDMPNAKATCDDYIKSNCDGNDVDKQKFDSKKMLDSLNKKRALIASGAAGQQPASNMNKLEWNDDLVSIAELAACYQATPDQICLGCLKNKLGMTNLSVGLIFHKETSILNDYQTTSVEAWFDQVKSFPKNVTKDKLRKVCQFKKPRIFEYIHIAYAKTTDVGCVNKESKKEDTILFCAFSPAPNFYCHLYEAGNPCSQCPVERMYCENNLCVTKDVKPVVKPDVKPVVKPELEIPTPGGYIKLTIDSLIPAVTEVKRIVELGLDAVFGNSTYKPEKSPIEIIRKIGKPFLETAAKITSFLKSAWNTLTEKSPVGYAAIPGEDNAIVNQVNELMNCAIVYFGLNGDVMMDNCKTTRGIVSKAVEVITSVKDRVQQQMSLIVPTVKVERKQQRTTKVQPQRQGFWT